MPQPSLLDGEFHAKRLRNRVARYRIIVACMADHRLTVAIYGIGTVIYVDLCRGAAVLFRNRANLNAFLFDVGQGIYCPFF